MSENNIFDTVKKIVARLKNVYRLADNPQYVCEGRTDLPGAIE